MKPWRTSSKGGLLHPRLLTTPLIIAPPTTATNTTAILQPINCRARCQLWMCGQLIMKKIQHSPIQSRKRTMTGKNGRAPFNADRHRQTWKIKTQMTADRQAAASWLGVLQEGSIVRPRAVGYGAQTCARSTATGSIIHALLTQRGDSLLPKASWVPACPQVHHAILQASGQPPSLGQVPLQSCFDQIYHLASRVLPGRCLLVMLAP